MNQNDIDREHRTKEVADLALSFLRAFLAGEACIEIGTLEIRLLRDTATASPAAGES